jgi:hypothetical protein
VVEEAGVPGENHRPWVSNWYCALNFCHHFAYLFNYFISFLQNNFFTHNYTVYKTK